MVNVKVFVQATEADADVRAMTLAPRTYIPAPLKMNLSKYLLHVKYCVIVPHWG